MSTDDHLTPPPPRENLFIAADVISNLQENHWLIGDPTTEQTVWATRAASLLGVFAENPGQLGDLLRLVFHYNAAEILELPDSHAVLARHDAREVIRQLATLLLDPVPLTSERFKEIIGKLRDTSGIRSRDLFHPVRLALAGRAGEGHLDRVLLLLDEAATLNFAVPVKSARTRILEFCASL
jgi:hypothetical protein